MARVCMWAGCTDRLATLWVELGRPVCGHGVPPVPSCDPCANRARAVLVAPNASSCACGVQSRIVVVGVRSMPAGAVA